LLGTRQDVTDQPEDYKKPKKLALTQEQKLYPNYPMPHAPCSMLFREITK
jgi:hypothetical protein